ncbi:hypothetical protein ACLB2K_011375 [Fragaria x ananassa]
MAPTRARLHPSRLQQLPRPLSLPGESAEFQFSGQITQNFKQSRSGRKTGIWWTRRGWKVVGEAAGVRWGGGAPSPVPYGDERRDVRTLRAVRTSAPDNDHDRKLVPDQSWKERSSPGSLCCRPGRREAVADVRRWRTDDVRTLSRSADENRKRMDSLGRESGRGRCWSLLGWRRAGAGAGGWRTDRCPHFKPSADGPLHIRPVISPENWNSEDSPRKKNDRGRCWRSLEWRRRFVRAVRWRTESGSEADVCTPLKCGCAFVLHSMAPTKRRLHPSGLQQRLRSLFLLGESVEFQFSGEITQNFKQNRSRQKTGIRRTLRGGKVIGCCWRPLGWRHAVVGAEGYEADVRTWLKVRTSVRTPPSGAGDGAPPPQKTPAASPTTFPPRRVHSFLVFRRDHPKLQTKSISLETGKKRTRRGREVVGDAAGVFWGGDAPSPTSEDGEQMDVRT